MIAALSQKLKERAVQSGRLYVLPTKNGALFAMSNFSLFMIGMVYANNLVLLLAFGLFALLLLILFQTHAYMENLGPVPAVVSDDFGDKGPLISLCLPETNHHWNEIFCEIVTENGVFKTSPAGRGRFCVKGAPRGRHRGRHIKVWTLGDKNLFKVWTYRQAQTSFYVYPSLKKTSMPAPLRTGRAREGAEEFNQHRNYQTGDSAKRIDWKVFARDERLLVKSYQEPEKTAYLIDINALCQSNKASADKEQILGMMAWQVDQAFKADAPWELRLGSAKLPSGKGKSHWRASMEALSEA